MTEIEQKILDKLNELELGPVKLYKCSRAGQMVDNGFGMDFPLSDYAVLTKEDMVLGDDEKYAEFAEFEWQNDIDVMKFCDEHYGKGLHTGLKADGYELIWQLAENNE